MEPAQWDPRRVEQTETRPLRYEKKGRAKTCVESQCLVSRLKEEPLRIVLDEDAFWGVGSVGAQSNLSGQKKNGLCLCADIPRL